MSKHLRKRHFWPGIYLKVSFFSHQAHRPFRTRFALLISGPIQQLIVILHIIYWTCLQWPEFNLLCVPFFIGKDKILSSMLLETDENRQIFIKKVRISSSMFSKVDEIRRRFGMLGIGDGARSVFHSWREVLASWVRLSLPDSRTAQRQLLSKYFSAWYTK